MRISSVSARNYRSFARLEEVRLGHFATIVGQNDVGKSNILRALALFFSDKVDLVPDDFHDGAKPDDDIVIEIAFHELPSTIQLEEGVDTTFKDENLLDQAGQLRIRKTFQRASQSKASIALVVSDFPDEPFCGIARLKEKELNARCTKAGLDVTKSGRGITNKGKRDELRAKAREAGIAPVATVLELGAKDDLWQMISNLLPDFQLFQTDTKLGVGETTFQSQFRPIIRAAAEKEDVVQARDVFTGKIDAGIQVEVDKVFQYLCRHTDALTTLNVRAQYAWDKAVSFDISGKDKDGCDHSLERRGSGLRRLLMVSFFQYLAERGKDSASHFVFAVEEPENCLHPGLQRELVASFRRLAAKGSQVIVTTHSPVIAGSSPIEDLALVVRTAGVAETIQTPTLDLVRLAEELGIEPADQVTGFDACVFVEGIADVTFLKTAAAKLKAAGHVQADFDDRTIGFIIAGGENLRHWVSMRAMARLNRRFGVVVDSDRMGTAHNIPGRKLHWKQQCENEGGIFFITRKRELENYLHKDALARTGKAAVPFDDFSDMKELFGENVHKVIEQMTVDELLSRDAYQEGGNERHEIKEMITALLALPDTSGKKKAGA